MQTSFPRKIGKIEKKYLLNKEIHNFRKIVHANMQPLWIMQYKLQPKFKKQKNNHDLEKK